MAKKRIIFFDTKPYDRQFFDEENKGFGYDIQYFEGRLNPETAKFSAGYDTVCAFVNDALTAEVIDTLSVNGVQLIAMRCAGYNNVDFKSAYGRIHVVRVPGYSPNAVAEHAVALMMTLNRKTHKAFQRTRDGNFSINGLLGFDFYGKTAGVIGTGKIGKCVIAILKGLGMKVLAYDSYPEKDFAAQAGFDYVGLDELYQQSDVITLHCPLTPETHYLINAYSIRKMKPGVMLINTGRGGLINTKDLIDGLKDRTIGAAGLDVYEEEGDYFFEDFSFTVIDDDVLARLLTFPNVLVTSHQAFFTTEALTNIARTTLENVQEFFDGGYLRNEVCYRCDGGCKKKQQKRCF
ncbi:MAG TPA: 2-hydroxyacid dehydrogenase [Candidatus Bathyarchaeia archaeon]|nr:2-hydroxyacid dehydrogenase [Candidatus Bathyarchaeia archaeon]